MLPTVHRYYTRVATGVCSLLLQVLHYRYRVQVLYRYLYLITQKSFTCNLYLNIVDPPTCPQMSCASCAPPQRIPDRSNRTETSALPWRKRISKH